MTRSKVACVVYIAPFGRYVVAAGTIRVPKVTYKEVPMNTDEISEIINLLTQIKEQGDVDDSLAIEIAKAIQTLEVEGKNKASGLHSRDILEVLSKVIAVLPEIKSVIELLTSFFE